MFAGFDLHIIHEGFAFKCSPGSPHVSRMDSICAIAVAYMWESSTVREDGRLRVFFSDGILTLDARLRNAFPKGKRAIHASPFAEAVRRLPEGASFSRYSPIESIGTSSRLLADPGRLYLVLDDKGDRLLTRETCGPIAMAKCPRSVTMVLGGTLGYSPHTADSIVSMLREAGARHTHKLAIGVRQQHASSIVAFLRSMEDDGHLRNARALTFYGAMRGKTDVSFEFRRQYCRVWDI